MMPARQGREANLTAHIQEDGCGASAATAGRAAAPAPAAPAPPDDMAQIQQLATMKDQGLLTEEEFQAKKKQILGIVEG